MVNILRKLLIIITASIGIIIALYLLAMCQRKPKKGGFYREFSTEVISDAQASRDMGYNSFYIAGVTPDNIYLGNSTSPFAVWMVDTSLSNIQAFPFHITDTTGIALRAPSLTVTPPNFYLMDGTVTPPMILTGNTETWKATPIRSNRAYFTSSIALNPHSFIHRSVTTKTQENELGKETIQPAKFTLVPSLLEKQVDGLFCTDGMLHYNREMAQLIYIYYYRNEFILADTTLSLIARNHTIDTTSMAKLKISEIASNGSTTFSAPPLTVNKHSCTAGQWLFIHSGIMAQNEHPDRFNHAAAIDVYNLPDGEYAFSFYIPDHGDEKLRQFAVSGNTLLAMFTSTMVKYSLNLPDNQAH